MGTENSVIESIEYTEEEIQKRIKILGKQISSDYDDELILIPILKGGLNFAYDLMKHIENDISIDFIKSKSYSLSRKITSPNIQYNPSINIKDKDVILVDDFVDTGETLLKLYSHLKVYEPRSIKIAAVIIKPDNPKISQIEKYFLWNEKPKGFLVGYGLDYDEKYRNIPYIGFLKKELFEK